MGLNMYHGEIEIQRNSMNAVCIELIQAMEQTKASINAFALSFNLQGKTYQTAKTFMTELYLPLAQGIIYLCEELIRQNDRYPNDFKADVSPMDMNEDEVQEQLREVERLHASLEQMQGQLAVLGISIPVYTQLEHELRNKIEQLYYYDHYTAGNYDTAAELATAIAQGLAQIEEKSGFEVHSGTFHTDKETMGWIGKIETIHFQRKAKETFAEHLQNNPNDLEKLTAILQFEEIHSNQVEAVNHMLKPLEFRDVVGIKHLMYTAEEPFRSLAMAYADEITLQVLPTDTDTSFSPFDCTIRYSPNQDRSNAELGDYSTFFRELGHAVDYQHAQAVNIEGFFSEHHALNGMRLAQSMHVDAENNIKQEAVRQLNEIGFEKLAGNEQQDIADRMAKMLTDEEPNGHAASEKESELLARVKEGLGTTFESAEHYVTADVFRGVTAARIEDNNVEWGLYIGESSALETLYGPDREGFANYFSSNIVVGSEEADGSLKELREDKLASVEAYLPQSKEHMDHMLQEMAEKLGS